MQKAEHCFSVHELHKLQICYMYYKLACLLIVVNSIRIPTIEGKLPQVIIHCEGQGWEVFLAEYPPPSTLPCKKKIRVEGNGNTI